jgi:CcmE
MRIRAFFYLFPLLGCHIGCLKAQPQDSTGFPPVSTITAEAQTPEPGNAPIPPPPQAFFTTIAEVVKRPGFFDGQKVRLSGKVTNLQPAGSRRGKSTSRFDLADGNGNKVRIDLQKPSALKVGQQVSVEGLLAIPSDPAVRTVVVLTGSRLVSKIARPVPAKKVSPPQGKPRPTPPQLFPPPPVESTEPGDGQVF